jgi:hypothetical protein
MLILKGLEFHKNRASPSSLADGPFLDYIEERNVVILTQKSRRARNLWAELASRKAKLKKKRAAGSRRSLNSQIRPTTIPPNGIAKVKGNR